MTDVNLEGALKHVNRYWRAFEHKGRPMTKREVKAVLEHGISKGYKLLSEMSDKEIDDVIKGVE